MSMPRLFCTLAATVLLSAPAPAQSILEGGRIESPVLGRFFDPQAKTIRTISGVPGSSSANILADGAFRYAVSAPHRPWSIVDRTDADSLELLTLGREGANLRAIPADHGVDRIAFSPSGDAALLYWRGSRVELWKGFGTTPERTASYSLEGIAGEVGDLAVTDDATVAAMVIAGEGEGAGSRIYALGEGISALGDAAGWSAIAFAPNSRTAYAANRATNEIVLFSSFGSNGPDGIAAADADGVSSPAALAISGDGRKLIVSNQDDPTIAVIDIESRRSTVLALERAADGLFALDGNAVFRLSAAPKPELFVLDADSAEARITAVTVTSAPTAGAAGSAPDTTLRASKLKTRPEGK